MRLCQPYQAKRKGKVEHDVPYVRERLRAPTVSPATSRRTSRGARGTRRSPQGYGLLASAERALAEQLTRAEQALFLLVAHDRLPVADAARSLGLSSVAGRMRLARARRKLRAAMR